MIAAVHPAAPAVRGYRPLYQAGSICPSCGATSWHIGRQSAECARCATALPFAPAVEARHG